MNNVSLIGYMYGTPRSTTHRNERAASFSITVVDEDGRRSRFTVRAEGAAARVVLDFDGPSRCIAIDGRLDLTADHQTIVVAEHALWLPHEGVHTIARTVSGAHSLGIGQPVALPSC